MDASSPAMAYLARLVELRAALRALDARSGRISTLRLVTLLAAAGFAGARFFRPVPPLVWALAAGFAAAFVALVIAHAVLITRMAALEVRAGLVERGHKRLAGDIAGLPGKGERFVVQGHAYARDLDVFGAASLFQLLDAAETGPGEATLARWISAPADAAEIAARQEAVRELAAVPRLREDLASAGVAAGARGRDVEPFLAWAETKDGGPSRALIRLGEGLVVITLGLFTAAQIAGKDAPEILRLAWLVPLVAQLGVLGALRPRVAKVLAPVSANEAPFGRYVALFRLVEATPLQAPRLAALRATLLGAGASRAIGRLQTVLGFAEMRQSGLFGVLANIAVLWDVLSADALIRWRARWGGEVRGWIAAVAELEALASLATLAYENPSYAFPEVGEGPLRFVAEGLGHPLLPSRRRVTNDVSLPAPGAAMMVTGSNMSGKSTLLRAVGVNAVLALAGAPVCARRLEMSVCRVRTSMRVDDSLEEGVSHFYAELERLKAVVDAVNAGERVLFLLDEVLHGTNSRERRLGARAVVLHLLARGAVGAVSSHDLGLADLEVESGGQVKNMHFQELVDGGKMTFDYKLKEGVVTSSNALRLMRLIGIAVDLPEA
jgi:hypothetical protein